MVTKLDKNNRSEVSESGLSGTSCTGVLLSSLIDRFSIFEIESDSIDSDEMISIIKGVGVFFFGGKPASKPPVKSLRKEGVLLIAYVDLRHYRRCWLRLFH